MRGRMLRAWREHAGLSSSELAEAIPVRRAAVSMWESGMRARRAAASVDMVKLIGDKLHLRLPESAAMLDLWQSAESVMASPARTAWAHNYQPPSGPAWAWLRPQPGNELMVASFWWGEPLQGSLETPTSSEGVVVQFPTTVSNPPLQIALRQPGWADFGRGIVPPDVAGRIGMRLVDARQIIGDHVPVDPPLSASDHRVLSPWFGRARAIADHFGLKWSLIAPHLGYAGRKDRAPQALDGASLAATIWPGAARVDADGLIVSQLLISPAQARQMRTARGLSRGAAAASASRLNPAGPVSNKAIEAIEAQGHLPEGRHVIARLDTIYNADGRLGIDRTFNSRWRARRSAGQCLIEFPAYWCGPVWLQATGPTPTELGILEITWGPWRRRQHIRSGGVVTTRKATTDAPPMRVRLPDGWDLAAGTGAVPSALDINRFWSPVSVKAAIGLLREGIAAVRRASIPEPCDPRPGDVASPRG